MNNKDIVFCILKFLPMEELFKCSLINKIFYRIQNSWMLWRYKLENELEITVTQEQLDNYKNICTKHIKLQYEYLRYSDLVKMHYHNDTILPFNSKLEMVPFKKDYSYKPICHYKCTLYSIIGHNKNIIGYQNLKLTAVTSNEFFDISNILLIELTDGHSSQWRLEEDVLMLLQKKYRITPLNSYKNKNMWHHEIYLPFDKMFGAEYVPKKFILEIYTNYLNNHETSVEDLFISLDLVHTKSLSKNNHCTHMHIICSERNFLKYSGAGVISDIYFKIQNEDKKTLTNDTFDHVNILFNNNNNMHTFGINMIQKMDTGHYHIALLQEEPHYHFQQFQRKHEILNNKNFTLTFGNLQRNSYRVKFYLLIIGKLRLMI